MSGEGERVHLNGWDQQHEAPPPRDPNRELIQRETADIYDTAVVKNADGVWRDAFGREYERDVDGTILRDGAIVEPPSAGIISWQNLTAWQGRSIPKTDWLLDKWIPKGQCTCLSGTPGSRKSTLVLQLALAMSTEQPYFIGTTLVGRTSMAYFCEDPEIVLAQRGVHMLRYYGSDFRDVPDFHYKIMVGKPQTELVYFTASGRLLTTPAFDRFKADIAAKLPDIVILDVIPAFYAGNENDRHQVHQFIRLLDGVAQEYGCAILFTAHPSLRGKADGTMTSGSTAWEGCVRSRLSLKRDDDKGDETTEHYILRREKSNHAKPGEEIHLIFEDGVFKRADEVGNNGQLRSLACSSKLLELLDVFTNSNRSVNPTRAASIFAKHPFNTGFSKREYEVAMESLMKSDPPRLKVVSHRRNGRDQEILSRT